MTVYSPNPNNPHVPNSAGATTLKIRWEAVIIAFAGLAMLAVAAIMLFIPSGTKLSTEPTNKEAAAESSLPASGVDAAIDASVLTIQDAVAIVDDARDLMRQGRWDEAGDRLAMIGESLREASGANTLSAELMRTQERWDALAASADRQVEKGEWSDARKTLDKLIAIAPLDGNLLELEDLVENALSDALVKEQKAAQAKARAERLQKNKAEAERKAAEKLAAEQRATSVNAASGGGAASQKGATTVKGTSKPGANRGNATKNATASAAAVKAAKELGISNSDLAAISGDLTKIPADQLQALMSQQLDSVLSGMGSNGDMDDLM